MPRASVLPIGQEGMAAREGPPPCVAFRQALSGACIASNQALAYKHISGQCAEEMLGGREAAGQGGAVNLAAAHCKGPHSASCSGQTSLALNHEICICHVLPVVSYRCRHCHGLACIPHVAHCAPQFKFTDRTIVSKTCRCHAQHKIGHGRIGLRLPEAPSNTHTCGVMAVAVSHTPNTPPPLHGHRASDIGRSTGPRRGRWRRGRGNKIARLSIWFFSSTRPHPHRAPTATATAPAPDHGTSTRRPPAHSQHSSSALWTDRPSTYPRDLVSSSRLAPPRLASRRGRSAACILIAMLRPSPARADRQSGSRHRH